MQEIKLYNLTDDFAFELDANANVAKIIWGNNKPLGYSTKLIINKPIWTFLLPNATEKLQYLIRSLKQNEVRSCELPLAAKNKQTNWYKVSVTCKIVNQKKFYIIYCNNINELKKQVLVSEKNVKELNRVNELNSQIIQSTQAIMLVLNTEKNIESISKGAEKVLGYKSKELINKNWFDIIVPSKKFPAFEKGYDEFIKSKNQNRIITAPVICKDKTQKNISWKTSKIINDGKLVGTVGIGKDITEITIKVRKLEASEKRFRNLAEQMVHPVSFVTIEGEFVFLNKAFTKQFGYTLKDFPNIETVVNKTKVDYKTKEEGIKSWQNEVKQLFQTQKPVTNKIEVETKNGTIRQVQYAASLAEGYVYYVYTDITEQKAKEDLLLKTSENFKQIAANIPVAIAGYSIATSKLTFANKHFTNAFGYTQKEINLMHDWGDMIVYENEIEQKKSLYIWEKVKKELFIKNKSIIKTLERKIRCKDGTIKNIEVAITYSTGIIYALFYDITSRKANETKLKESEARFKKLAELVHNPVAFIDIAGNILFFNKAFTNQFGYSVTEVSTIKKLIEIGYKNIEDRNLHIKNWQDEIELLKVSKKIKSKRLIVLTKKGEKRVIEYSASLNNNIIYYSYADITLQLEKEKLLLETKEIFRRIAENTPIAIAGCDIKTYKITFLNKKFLDAFGYNQNELKNFNNWRKYIVHNTEADQMAADTVWKKIVQELITKRKHKIKLLERKILCKDQNIRIFEIGLTYDTGTVYAFFYDVTERKVAENKLKESEERFRNLAENLPVPVVSLHAEKGLIFANQKQRELLGYNNDSVKKTLDFTNYIVESKKYPNAKKNYLDRLRILKHNQETKPLILPPHEMEIMCLDGVIRTFEISETIFGKILYAIFHDTTEQRKAETKLLESEDRFRNIVENLPIPLISLNPITGVLFSNKKHKELIGHHNNLTAHKGVEDLSNFSIDDMVDEESKQKYRAIINKVKNNNATHPIIEPTYTSKLICRDKQARTFEITESIFESTLYTLFHDITEQLNANELLKESEQKFKALAENMPIAIGGYDVEGKTIFVNKYFTDITGYNQQDVPTIKDWYKQTQPNTTRRIEFYNYWTQSVANFRNGKLIEKPEIKATSMCKDGSFKYFNYSFSIYKDITYILIIDITEEEKAKKQLEKSHQELRNLASYLQNIREEERKNISREIHDELGQQLTGIKMEVSAIFKKIKVSKNVQETEFKEVLDMLNFSVKTVRKISSQLRPSILDDLGLIAAFEWLIQDFRKRSSVNCHFYNDIDEKEISIDLTNNLFRILQESLTNIMRHASATLVNIDFFMIADQIRLIIADNGKGFNQNSPKATLGILGMRERTAILNGTFVIVSEKMKGTRIIISIPFKK